MKRLALPVLALAVIVTLPASAQSGVPVKNALVVVSGEQDLITQSMIATGGSPSNVRKALETTKLFSSSPFNISTDASGKFALNKTLQPGTYYLNVFASGFTASSDSMVIDGSGAAKNLTIIMQPSAILSGRITDERDKPIPGIAVAASSPHSANYDITTDDGVFVLDTGLKTGQYDIYAFKPGINIERLQDLDVTRSGLIENKIASIFKTSNVGYISNFSQVHLEQGKFSTLNLQLKSSYVISGRVIDRSGSPVSDVAVFAFDNTGKMVDSVGITDSTGKYVLDNDLANGKYTIVVPSLLSKGYAPASATVSVPVENSIDFGLVKSKIITGRVLDANGNPVANASVVAISKGLNADDTPLAYLLSRGMGTAKTDEQGRFTIDQGIGSGRYVVTASFGSVPVSKSVEVQAGNPANIILDYGETIVIKGKVTDSSGKPIGNASVAPSFASAVTNADLFVSKTDPDGTYKMTIPLKDNSTRSLFDEIVVSAEGYKTTTAPESDGTVKLDKMPPTTISGIVIAQRAPSPSVETVLVRNGTVIFEYGGAKYDVGLRTNSHVVDAKFDSDSKSIRINLEGMHNAASTSEFSIPKKFMTGPFVVSLDGNRAESVRISENETATSIAIEQDHDLQEITIQATSAVPEFPVPGVMAAICLAGGLVWIRLRR